MPNKYSETIDITPDPSMMEDIGSASYTLYQAINELLANTFDARSKDSNGSPIPVRVDIDINPGVSVQISDNACGMKKDTLVKALTLGFKMDRIQGARSRKGMYGLGMKTAAASLGRVWEIWTRHAKDDKDYYARFDLEEFKTRWKRDQKDLWTLVLETHNRTEESPLGDRKTGTVIKVTQVRDENPDVGVVEGHVGASYRVEVKNFKDCIYINNREIDIADPSIVEGTKQDLDFEVEVRDKKHRVKGYWGRLPKYNNDGEYGFDLYRYGQLISGNLKEPLFSAHNTLSNFYATLELPFINANYHKKGFDYGSEEWKALEAKMRDEIMPPILREVRKWKAKDLKNNQQGGGATSGARVAVGTGPTQRGVTTVTGSIRGEDISSGAQSVAGIWPTPVTKGGSDNPQPVEAPGSIKPGGVIAQSALDWKIIQFKELEPFLLTFELIPMNSEITPWTYVPPAGDRTLLVKINVDSVLYKKSQDSNSFAMFAVADCVGQYLIEVCKQDPKQVRTVRNEWLKRAATTKLSEITKQALNK
jgi:hypothetical protein